MQRDKAQGKANYNIMVIGIRRDACYTKPITILYRITYRKTPRIYVQAQL